MIPKAPKRTGRTKKTRKKDRDPTQLEWFHMGRIKALGCVCCERLADYHHVKRFGGIRDHKWGFGVCKEHHTDGPYSIHAMGFEPFQDHWDLNLEEIMRTSWEESVRLFG
jgi:hypothetical protein